MTTPYRRLQERTTALDARNPAKYRFDAEHDIAWDRIADPGDYCSTGLLDDLGVEWTALQSDRRAWERFQWAYALTTCHAFILLEEVILRFLDQERRRIDRTKATDWLAEEEIKHIHVFKRYAEYLRSREPYPGACLDFDAHFRESTRVLDGPLESAQYPNEGIYHYAFWLKTVFFEEFTVCLDECLRRHRDVVQPAWITLHRAHRREEEQHVVTDVAHIDALALSQDERAGWSKLFLVDLATHAGHYFCLETPWALVRATIPAVARSMRPRPLEESALLQVLRSSRFFRRTRASTPGLEEWIAARQRLASRAPEPTARSEDNAAANGQREGSRAVPGTPEVASAPTAASASTLQLVREIWAEVLETPLELLGADTSFASLGGDSVRAVEIHCRVEEHYGREIGFEILERCRTIGEFATYLDSQVSPSSESQVESGHTAPADPTAVRAEDIAVVGMTGRFPGGADLEQFWRLLAEGRSAFRRIPPSRWDVEAFHGVVAGTPGKAVCDVGAFLDDVDLWDPSAFGLTEAHAIDTDPQQRLFLELAADLLDAAGRPTRDIGVFAATGWNAYLPRYAPHQIGPLTAIGNLHNMVAARVSQILGLRGPAFTVDAACASSLVAVHLACRSLRDGECEAAIAGGVELLFNPQTYLSFEQAGVMSATGRCAPFSASASGFLLGEGGAAVLLRPLRDALADGDDIVAVIRGSAVTNDGGGYSAMSPSPEGQMDMLRRAYRDAAVDPGTVSLIEAHGTATPVGDAVELRALSGVLTADRAAGRCAVGSVKSNIGHLFSAAGIAGLIKVLLCFRHRTIAPIAGFDRPHERHHFDHSPFYPSSEATAWEPPHGVPRRAGVTALGVGGSNCHVVLEEGPPVSGRGDGAMRAPDLLMLCAPDDAGLRRVVSSARRCLDSRPDVTLDDFCASMNRRAYRFETRCALVADSRDHLRAQLNRVPPSRRVRVPPKVMFVFSAPGAQYVGMGRHLYEGAPEFRRAFSYCDQLLGGRFDRSLASMLYETPQHNASDIDRIEVTQPLMFAFSYALTRWLAHLGIRPDGVMGHSAGEYAASCAAGVLDVSTALDIVVRRGRLMAETEPGAMSAVFAPLGRVRPLVAQFDQALGIAAVNDPTQVVVSGALDAMRQLRRAFDARQIHWKDLNISCAAHSPLMRQARGPFAETLRDVTLHPARSTFYSTLDGAKVRPERVAEVSYWLDHLSEPVRFQDAVAAAAEDGFTLFIEVGPSSGLCQSIRLMFPQDDTRITTVPLNSRSQAGWLPTLGALGALYCEGVPLDVRRVSQGTTLVRLPPYPYDRRRFWAIDRQAPSDETDEGPDFERALVPSDEAAIRDHRIDGRPAAPAVLLMDWALRMAPSRGLADVVIARPLVLEEERTVRVSRDLAVRSGQGEEWIEHLTARPSEPGEPPAVNLNAIPAPDGLLPDALYSHLERNGLSYGPTMRSVVEIRRGERDVVARIEPPLGGRHDGELDPAVMDGAMQAIGAFTLGRSETGTFLGFAVRRLSVYEPVRGSAWAHIRLNGELARETESFSCDIVMLSLDGRVLAEMEEVWLKRARRPIVHVRAVDREEIPEGSQERVAGREVWLIGDLPRLAELLEAAGVEIVPGAPDWIVVDPSLEELAALVGDTARRPDSILLATRRPETVAYLRTFGLECPACRSRAVLFEGELSAARIRREWGTAEERFVVMDVGGRRMAPILRTLQPGREPPPCDVCWVVGGTGGLGGTIVETLREHGAKVLVTSRTATAAETDDRLVRAADITNRDALARAAAEAVTRWGRLDLVVHAAGVLDDAPIGTHAPEDQRRVTAPKIAGTENLLAVARQHGARTVLFSSIASLFPSPGQADYAAANAYQDAADAQVINWGPWRDVGMVRERRFGGGLDSLSPVEGIRAFWQALACDDRQVLVAKGDASRLDRFNLREPAPQPVRSGPLADFVLGCLATRLRCRPQDLDPTLPFAALGVDSLMAVEMVVELERRYSLRLHPTLLFEKATLSALVEYLDKEIGSDRPVGRTVVSVGVSREPEPHGVEIEVRAIGVNFIDVLASAGLHPARKGASVVPGHEVAGLAGGSRVMAVVPHGGFSRRVVAPEANVLPLPEGFSFEEGAAVMISGITAVACLEHYARLAPGERILVQAAAGATGLAMVQLARHLGAEIFGTASRPDKLEHLRSIGVAHVINYRTHDYVEVIRETTGGEGIDVIVDSLSGDEITRGLQLLRTGGRFVEIGAAGVVETPTIDPGSLFMANQQFLAVNVMQLAAQPALLGRLRDQLASHLQAGVIRPAIGHVLPFEQADEALQLIRQRRNIGKVVLTLP